MNKRIPLDVVDDQGNSLYVSERKVYPRDVSGRFNRLRVAAVLPLAAQAQAHAPPPDLAAALAQVHWYPAVPLAVQRVAGIERAQMLLESPSRAALQQVLAACAPRLHALRTDPAHRAVVRWAVDVDPLAR